MKPSNKENKLLSEKLKKETELMEKELMLVEKLVSGNNINLKSLLKTGINSKNTKKLIENIDKIDINEHIVTKKEDKPIVVNKNISNQNNAKISNKNLNKIEDSKINKATSKGKIIKSAKISEKIDINMNMDHKKEYQTTNTKNERTQNTNSNFSINKQNSINSNTEENNIYLLSSLNIQNSDNNNQISNLTEKEKDQLYWNQLSNKKKFEYKLKYNEVYKFLNEINLSRYIEIFLEEGFTSLDLLLMISEEFLSKKSFKSHQISAFMNQINIHHKGINSLIDNSKSISEVSLPKKETHEFSINTDDNLFIQNKNISICWNCLKSCKNESLKYIDEKSFYPDKVVIIIIILGILLI